MHIHFLRSDLKSSSFAAKVCVGCIGGRGAKAGGRKFIDTSLARGHNVMKAYLFVFL